MEFGPDTKKNRPRVSQLFCGGTGRSVLGFAGLCCGFLTLLREHGSSPRRDVKS